MAFSGFASSLVGAAGSFLGGQLDAHYSRENTRAAQAFQREVLQNQLQWRAADAKKAGLHPLAALGTSPASGAVGTAGIGSTFSDSLGKLGEGIGDAFTAYMSRDEIAAEKAKADARFNREMDLLDAQIGEIRARTQESITRGLSYMRPRATGREYIPGQVESGSSSLPPSNPGSSVTLRAMPSRTGSRLQKAYDINMSTERQQELGDEAGQVYNFIEKAARENNGYYFDLNTGLEYKFNRHYGEWWPVYTGGGGGV